MNLLHSKTNRSFLDYFPPPKLLSMPYAGVAISDHFVRMIKLEHTVHGLRVGKFDEIKIPHGILEAGYINNVDEFAAILRELKRKHKLTFVQATLPEERSYIFRTEFANVKGADI